MGKIKALLAIRINPKAAGLDFVEHKLDDCQTEKDNQSDQECRQMIFQKNKYRFDGFRKKRKKPKTKRLTKAKE